MFHMRTLQIPPPSRHGIGLVFAGLTALGTVLPWVNVFGVTQWGLARPEGLFLLPLAGLQAAVALNGWLRRRPMSWLYFPLGTAGMGIAGLAFWQIWRAARPAAQAFNALLAARGGPTNLAVTGWSFLGSGLYLAVIGQTGMDTLGLISLRDALLQHPLPRPIQAWRRLKAFAHLM